MEKPGQPFYLLAANVSAAREFSRWFVADLQKDLKALNGHLVVFIVEAPYVIAANIIYVVRGSMAAFD